jgi:hypothetical protein
MFYESAPRLSNAYRGLVLGLSLSAAAGWGSFLVSRHFSTEMELQLDDQIASLLETRDQLLSERMKAQVSLSEMAQLRADLTAARGEVSRLSQLHQAQADHPPAGKTGDEASATGPSGVKAAGSQPVKKASAGKAQLSDRNGQPTTVKVAAQGMPAPSEVPQKRKAQANAAELDTAGLRQLAKSTGTSAPE